MKIALVSNLYTPYFAGGAEVSCELLARGLREAGHEPLVMSAAIDRPGPYTDEIDGVMVHRLRTGTPYSVMELRKQHGWKKWLWHGMDLWNPVVYAGARRILRQQRPDVVHTNVLAGLSPSIWSAARSLGIPVLHTLRDYYLLCVRSCLAKADGEVCKTLCPLCRRLTWWYRRLSGRIDSVAGVSRSILTKHLEFGFFSRIPTYVVYNAVALDEAASTASEAREPGRPIRAVYMGALESYKGIEVVLKALARMPEMPFHLRVCGTGPQESMLRDRYGGDRRVVFEGVVSGARKHEILASSDVMVVPSLWHEAFGRTVIEGYQYGLAVIASRIGGLPEIVEHGVSGWLFDAGDDAQLAGLLAELTSRPEPLAAMRRHVVHRVRDFSLDRHVENYLTIYRTLAGASRT